MIRSTSILLINFFLKKNSIWSLFSVLTSTTRSAARQETNTDPGDTMQGVIKTIPPRNLNSFIFDYDDEEFQVVKSKANKRKDKKKQDSEAGSSYMQGQKPPLRMVHNYVPYEIPKNLNVSTKKTATSKPPDIRNVGKTHLKPLIDQRTQPTGSDANNGKKHEVVDLIIPDPIISDPIISNQPDKEKIDAQPISDQSIPTGNEQYDPNRSAARGAPDIDMDDKNFKPISIEKQESFKLLCTIPEGEDNIHVKKQQLMRERESRTGRVFNIPLNMENPNIKAVFSRYGELEEDGISTRLKGLYRQALITYKDEQSIERFYHQWSIWAFKECLTVVPVLLSEEKRSERNNYVAKINGLPPNTCARDLQGLVNEVSAAAIFVPKNPVTYRPMKYAFVYFKNEEDFNIGINNVYEYEGRQLEWSSLDVKSCHRCGYTRHMAIECEVDNRRQRPMNRTQLLQQFRDRNRRKYQSYADATKQKNIRRQWNQTNINHRDNNLSGEEGISDWGDGEETDNNAPITGGTKVGGSIHDKQRKNNNVQSRDMDEVKKQLENLSKMFTEFQEDNSKIKQEIKTIREEIKQNKTKKVSFNRKSPVINSNNKRTKADTSSSENDENDVILNLESKVEKQDQMLNNMFNITGKIDTIDNQNDDRTSNIGGIGSSPNVNNQY
ncbi:unnamed protein product [Rhizophagus irregularis]|nr:unnamed protein product [Rhizophagus irregularis]